MLYRAKVGYSRAERSSFSRALAKVGYKPVWRANL
jgi:hypothetical protein